MLRRLIIFVFILLFKVDAIAQDTVKTRSWGVETGASVSVTGVNYYTGIHYQLNKLSFVGGAKIANNRMNSSRTGPLGIISSVRYNFTSQNKWTPFCFLDYNLEFLPVYLAEGNSKQYNQLHELYFGYGINYRINKSWVVGNSIGLGGYYEKYLDSLLNKTLSYKNPYAQGKIFLRYDF